MLIKINENNEIEEYAIFGGLPNSIEVADELQPTDFKFLFKPNLYLYQDNEIIVNPNYQKPSIEIPTPEPSGPSAEQQAITDLAINSAEHDQHIQSIEEAITALAQSQTGGTN